MSAVRALLARGGRALLFSAWVLAASALLAELVLRLVPSLNRSQVPLVRRMSLELHHELVPLVSGVELDWGPRRVGYATDSLGLRDRTARRVDLADGRPRVLALGDSFVEGVGVAYGDTVCARLEALLRRAEPELEVLNAGVVSYAPILEYLRLRQLLARGLAPRRVLVFLDPGDPMDEVSYVEDFATFDHQGEPVDMARHDPWRGESLAGTVWRRLRTSSLLVWNLEELLRPDRGPGPARPHPTGYQPHPAPRWRDLQADRSAWVRGEVDWETWGRRGVAYIRADLRRMRGLAERRGFPIAVVVYPTPTLLRNPWQLRFARSTWAEAVAGEGLELVDLSPEFLALPDWRAAFIPGDEHWAEEGHRLVAEALAQRVFGVTAGQ